MYTARKNILVVLNHKDKANKSKKYITGKLFKNQS